MLPKLLFALALLFAVAPARAADTRLQRQYEAGMEQIFRLMIAELGDVKLPLQSGKSVRLSQLQAKIKNIDFVPSSFIFTSRNLGDISCLDTLRFQWITAADSPNGRATIGYPYGNTLQDVDGQVWRTIVHETFGALGYVDDEYQITAPLFAALSARTPAEKAGSLALLVDIKTRKHAPTYELDGSLHCYKWKGGAGTLLKDKNGVGMLNGKSGNSTGVGGGGDNESFTFKTDLMLVAKSWWDKNADGSPAEYARFTKLVKELGVEPLNRDQERLMLLFPIQLEFKKSRRTGKLTAYLLVDSLASDRGQDDSFWNSALDKVLGHVYHHMLPAKSKAERERPAVYGRELAKNRGLSDDEDLLQGFQGPFFGKNKQ